MTTNNVDDEDRVDDDDSNRTEVDEDNCVLIINRVGEDSNNIVNDAAANCTVDNDGYCVDIMMRIVV